MMGAPFKEQPISIRTHEQTGVYCRRGDACSGDAHAKAPLTERLGSEERLWIAVYMRQLRRFEFSSHCCFVYTTCLPPCGKRSTPGKWCYRKIATTDFRRLGTLRAFFCWSSA